MMRISTLPGYLAPAILLVCTALPGAAQNTGRITGQIRDGQNRPLSGATVVLQPSNLGTTTDANGQFTLTDVAPGSYTVTVSFLGYRTSTQSITVGTSQ